MKEILKKGFSLVLRLLIVNIMCFFVAISISVLATKICTKEIGYTAYGVTSENSSLTELYTYNYDDVDDNKKAEYEKQGYTVQTSDNRSDMSASARAGMHIITQLFCLGILISFVYPDLWHLGTKDSNLVHFKHKKEDKLKGLKIGFIAVLPFFIVLLLLIADRIASLGKFPLLLYKFINTSFYSIIDVIVGDTVYASGLSVLKIVMLFAVNLIIPLIGFVAYYLGYRNFSISDRLIYKKKEKN